MILRCLVCNQFLESVDGEMSECSCSNGAFIKGEEIGATDPNKVRRYTEYEPMKKILDLRKIMAHNYKELARATNEELKVKSSLLEDMLRKTQKEEV